MIARERCPRKSKSNDQAIGRLLGNRFVNLHIHWYTPLDNPNT